MSPWTKADVDRIQARQERTPRAKYGAVKTTIDGIVFDSKREAARYSHLKLLEKAGQISELTLQPKFDLHVAGVKVCAYVGDFQYRTGITAAVVIEDVKGVKTPVYQLKKKMLAAEYGIQIQEIA